MGRMTPYLLYIKIAAAIALLLGAYAFGHHNAKQGGKLALAKELAFQAEAYRAQVEQWQKAAIDADDALRKAQAAIPRTGQRVSDEVRNNPTSVDCVVPDAVVDRLQEGVNASAANAAR